MPHFPHSSDIRKVLPLTIRQNKQATAGKCDFTISMSKELAEQFSLIAAPFMRDLCDALAREKQREEKQRNVRLRLESESHALFLHGLKLIRLQRFHQGDMLELCEEYGLRHDIDPHILMQEAKRLQQRRTDRLLRFKEHRIITLHKAGHEEKHIANSMHIPVRHVRKAITNHASASMLIGGRHAA